jgi:hypothetical protein
MNRKSEKSDLQKDRKTKTKVQKWCNKVASLQIMSIETDIFGCAKMKLGSLAKKLIVPMVRFPLFSTDKHDGSTDKHDGSNSKISKHATQQSKHITKSWE